MKFILWFTVFYGLVELEYWRTYKYYGTEWANEHYGIMLSTVIINLIIFLVCWFKFIN